MNRNRRKANCAIKAILVTYSVLAIASPNIVFAQDNVPVRYGAKLVKQELSVATSQPVVRVLDNPADWALVDKPGFTGTNPREFFFTLESERNMTPPRVEVTWPKVDIARVIGAADKTEQVRDGVRFTLHKGNNSTSVKTMLDDGPFIRMAIFHNWEVRRLGDYQAGEWPANEIQAQLNFLFAAREMCRAMGYHKTTDPGFDGTIHLYGFETNFPNQHVDAPPHFHILLAWPGWNGTQVTHFRLNDAGRITVNDFQSVDGKSEQNRKFGVGEVCEMLDPNGKKGFELVITKGGRGVVMRKSLGGPEFRLSPDSETDSSIRGVEIHRRDSPNSKWQPICWVRAEDDPVKGVLHVVVKPVIGEPSEELLHYDPDTGRQLETRSVGARRIDIGLKGSFQNAMNSPDGESLLFTNWRNGYNRSPADLLIVDLQTLRLRKLVSNE